MAYTATEDGRYIVHDVNVIAADWVVFSVWEHYAKHSTLTFVNGTGCQLGRVGTRRLPADLDVLTGDARYTAVRTWQAVQYEEAYRVIETVHGDAIRAAVAAGAKVRRDMGQIDLFTPAVNAA